ncbi:MAG: serine--tRNA ligase [Candidatus Scalindua sp. AMX11]|nr:MAG: serine--tRNA ligase [Candidatus Scalindua sp.]NOG83264.1 serine--tRNA ligase [Planctomycetota bacterium]RZV71974.1 MAG: serine--tRNA ligase [Candidatus Scalindua sp. SCAELEC01]TDE63342.1 MAG: serine--tRNA ligase [Candidatus Scalindua sp. AMX11]GJQ60034.1 MAG: serine--tRNA ligase [Candidatus Scalindua sp.]
MLDINLIRRDFKKVKRAIVNKNEKTDISSLQELDLKHRKLLHECEELRHKKKAASKQISGLQPGHEETISLIKAMKGVSNDIKQLEIVIKNISEEIHNILLRIPNIPADDVPVGLDPESNIEVKTWGEKKSFTFTPLPHWDLGKSLDILDFERASKISGTGFTIYKGAGALLERALYSFMLDLHTREHEYREIIPPFLVNRASMTGTGQLPKLEEDMYKTSEEDLFLIPTGEVPITNMHANEILSYQHLPINYATYTACFRREAGSHGKETRGMTRVHQFNKVELVKFVTPETSNQELEAIVSAAEKVMQLLGLQYRIIKLCTGDLSFAAAKCYDIEAWAPGINNYLEVSSCSNFEDFQARRCSIRFRDEKGTLKFVHTLNGSGVALPRTMIAILETYQQRDGTIEVPEVLRPYMGGLSLIKSL